MTTDQFDLWFKQHCAAFPSIATWFGKLQTPAETMAVWARVLDSIEYEDATAVTQAMAADPSLLPNYNKAELHPATVARLARERQTDTTDRRPQYHDGQQAFRCKLCMDDGRLIVYHWKTVRLAAGKSSEQGEIANRTALSMTMAVRCSCEAGATWATPLMVTYDPAKHLIPDPGHNRDESRAAIKAFAEATAPTVKDHRNYKPEFAEFAK